MKNRHHLLAAVTWCIAAIPADAQEVDTTKVYQSPEVVITSTRTSEPLQQVPMAVSIVGSEQFSTGRRYELKDALWSVPGVLTQARSGHTDVRITIRGYGARGAGNRSNAGNMRGIRVLLDGVPETEPDGRTSLDLVNLDASSHIEVLRSNSSTLYGSASGGVINLFTNLTFDKPFIETRNTVGSFDFMRNSLNVGTKFGATNFFVSAVNTTFGDDTNNAFRKHSGASQFLVSMGLMSHLDANTELAVLAGGTSNIFRFPGPLTKQQFEADPRQANATFVSRDERRFNRQGRIALLLDHEFSEGQELGGTVYFQPKILERSERNTYRDFNRYGIGSQARYSWEEEFSPTLQSHLSAGFDHQYQDGSILFYKLSPGGVRNDTMTQNKQEGAQTVGGYIEETMTIDSVLTIKVGGRYDRITYTFRNFIVPEVSGPPQSKTFTHFTPKAGISYRIASGHSIYGSFGGGVEAPAYNEVDPPSDSLVLARGGTPDPANSDFNPLLEPSTSTSIELGARGVVGLDGPVSYVAYDVAAYLINISNDLVPWNGGAFYFTAAKSRRTGIELGLQAGTTFGLSMQGAFTIGQSKYLEYENQLGNFDNNTTAGLPSTYGSVHLRYDAPFDIFVEAAVDHVGEYFADDRNDKRTDGSPDPTTDSKSPAYSLLGLTAGWKHDFSGLGVDLFVTVNNVADRKYVSSVFINGDANQYFEPGMSRNVVVGLGIRYR